MSKYIYVSTKELKQRYRVFGSFYNQKLKNGMVIECRNDLNIIDKSYFDEKKSESKVMLLMILMNPGKSKPLNDEYEIPTFNRMEATKLIKDCPYVPAKIDETMKQVMRLMANLKISHARIINVSDIRNKDSNEFAKEIEMIDSIDTIHSLFCEERRIEREQVFSSIDENAVIFKAWGKSIVDNSITFRTILEDKCVPALPAGKTIRGLEGKTKLHYSHPLPKGDINLQKKWINDACSLLISEYK
jgi:hypothetical protein